MLKHIFFHSLIQPLMMASAPPESEAGGGSAPAPIDPAQGVVGEELPEGFTSWEDYRQKQLSAEGNDTAPAAEGDDTAPAAEAPEELTQEQKDARTAEMVRLSTEGMAPEMAERVTPFVESFAKNGTLTDVEVKAAAEATGMSEAMVRQYMDGALYQTEKSAQEASVAQAAAVKPFYDTFGGEAQFTEFQQWASDPANLSTEEAKAFNEALDKSPAAALELAKVYKARMEASGAGADPVDLTRGGGTNQQQDNTGYASFAEQQKDQEDPRYRDDPEFRKKVEAKIARSNY